MIPKIIHYCWLSDDPIPENLQNYMKSWKEKLPDYEFILWNFKRFEKSSSQWVSQAFDNKKYAFAAYYIRLFAVYNFGGFYLDMDIQVLKSFNGLLNNELCLAFENDEKTGIEAGCFGAEKGNKIIGECLDYYKNRSFIKSDGSFDTLPLPKIMYKYISKHPELEIFEKDYFTAKSFETGQIEKTDRTFSIHHFAGSWLEDWEKQVLLNKEKIHSKIKPVFFAKVIFAFYSFFTRFIKTGINKTLEYYKIK